MKKILILIVLLTALMGCNKIEPALKLIGQWAMVDGTISDNNGTSCYERLGKNVYYEYIEFKDNGTFIRTYLPSYNFECGTYTYNDATRQLLYKCDGDYRFSPATIHIISQNEIIIITDWGSIGGATEHLIRLK